MEGNIVNYITQIRGVSYKPSDLHDSLNENSIILLRANNIDDGKINFEDVVYVDKSKVSETQILRENDVLICASSGSKNLVGKAASFNGNIECTFGAFCKVIRPRNILGSYLSAFFQSKYYRFHISQFANGANINNIKNEHINSFSIPERTLEEQKEISYKVFSLKRVIEKYNRELELLDELVKARFVEMFGDPIYNTQNRPITEFINVVKMQRGYDLPVQDRNHEGSIPVYGANGVLGYHDVAKINNGGIITGRSGTIGKVYLANKEYWPLNTSLFSIETYGNNLIYLQYLVTLYDLKRFVEGTGVPTLNRNMFHNKKIIEVPINEQNTFASFVEEIDKSRSRIQKSLEASQELFDSLMQEYFG